MDQDKLIDAFVYHLRNHGHPGLEVEQRPDKVNRKSPEIDGIAGPLRIEHTSIDTLENQRRDFAWFTQVVGGLDEELHDANPFRLNVTLEYDAVRRGQGWSSIRQSLRNWILDEAPRISDGHHVLENIAGIPFRLNVIKRSDKPSRLSLARFDPGDRTLSARVRDQVDRKAEKLAKYHGPGNTTVLLIENDDLSLMHEGKILVAMREAYPYGLPDGVDQIWYADTSIPSEIEFRNFTQDILQGNVRRLNRDRYHD